MRRDKTAPAAHGLAERASLAAAANATQYLVRLLTGLVLSPLIIRGLGAEIYGAWTMIQQTVGYLALGDLRASGTLKFTLAVRQHSDDAEERRRQVGAAVLVSLRVLPFMVLGGVALVWAAPLLIRTAHQHQADVRWAVALSALAVAATQLLYLPGNVLRGMNLEYRGTFAVTGVLFVSGVLSVIAVWGGLGIAGVAGAGLAGSMLTGLVYYRVARRTLPWFGYSKPSNLEFRTFTRQTIWLFLGSFGQLLLNSSDLLLVGVLLGPSSAGVYAVTGAVVRMTGEPIFSLLSSANAGVAGLCGRREWRRVGQVRLELHLIAILLMALIGTGVIALNEAFLRLWVGPGYYAGRATNLLLVVAAAQGIWIRLDAMIADAMLHFRGRALLSGVSGVLGLAGGGALVWALGLPGMALGTVIGRAVGLVGFPWLISRGSSISMKAYVASIWRPATAGVALFLFAASLALPQLDLLRFALWVVAVGAAAVTFVWTAGFGPEQRSMLRRRLGAQLGPISSRWASAGGR